MEGEWGETSFFLSFDLYVDVEKLSGGWVVVHLDYIVSHGPRPGPELDKNMSLSQS